MLVLVLLGAAVATLDVGAEDLAPRPDLQQLQLMSDEELQQFLDSVRTVGRSHGGRGVDPEEGVSDHTPQSELESILEELLLHSTGGVSTRPQEHLSGGEAGAPSGGPATMLSSPTEVPYRGGSSSAPRPAGSGRSASRGPLLSTPLRGTADVRRGPPPLMNHLNPRPPRRFRVIELVLLQLTAVSYLKFGQRRQILSELGFEMLHEADNFFFARTRQDLLRNGDELNQRLGYGGLFGGEEFARLLAREYRDPVTGAIRLGDLDNPCERPRDLDNLGVVVFRGTQQGRDVLTDLMIRSERPVLVETAGGELTTPVVARPDGLRAYSWQSGYLVEEGHDDGPSSPAHRFHGGFFTDVMADIGLRRAMERVGLIRTLALHDEQLIANPPRDWLLTGHSLGAAKAQITQIGLQRGVFQHQQQTGKTPTSNAFPKRPSLSTEQISDFRINEVFSNMETIGFGAPPIFLVDAGDQLVLPFPHAADHVRGGAPGRSGAPAGRSESSSSAPELTVYVPADLKKVPHPAIGALPRKVVRKLGLPEDAAPHRITHVVFGLDPVPRLDRGSLLGELLQWVGAGGLFCAEEDEVEDVVRGAPVVLVPGGRPPARLADEAAAALDEAAAAARDEDTTAQRDAMRRAAIRETTRLAAQGLDAVNRLFHYGAARTVWVNKASRCPGTRAGVEEVARAVGGEGLRVFVSEFAESFAKFLETRRRNRAGRQGEVEALPGGAAPAPIVRCPPEIYDISLLSNSDDVQDRFSRNFALSCTRPAVYHHKMGLYETGFKQEFDLWELFGAGEIDVEAEEAAAQAATDGSAGRGAAGPRVTNRKEKTRRHIEAKYGRRLHEMRLV